MYVYIYIRVKTALIRAAELRESQDGAIYHFRLVRTYGAREGEPATHVAGTANTTLCLRVSHCVYVFHINSIYIYTQTLLCSAALI